MASCRARRHNAVPFPQGTGVGVDKTKRGKKSRENFMFIYIVWAFIGELPPFSTR
jgi:hypothetical protein